MIGRYLTAAQAVARELRRGLLSLPSLKQENWFQFWQDSRPIFERADELIARTLRDAQLAGWVDAAESVFRRADRAEPGPDDETVISLFDHPLMASSPVPLTATTAGVSHLARLRAVTRDEFDSLEGDARRTAFTVARVAKQETVAQVLNVISEAVQTGMTYRAARPALTEALNDAPLGEHHVEAIYRTYYGRAQTAGKMAVLDNPMVKDEFPYFLWTAAHDSRTETSHLDMEKAGLDGTAVYRADDPIWNLLLPPVRWNCRCDVIPLSIEDAASYGCREAMEWERTGRPPVFPHFVRGVPLRPVKGWVPTGGRLLAA